MSVKKADLVAVLVVLVIAVGFGLGVLRPSARKLDERRKEIAAAVQEARDIESRASGQSALYASIQELRQDLRDQYRRLPTQRQFGEFLNALTEGLRHVGIEDVTVEPRLPLDLHEERMPEALQAVRGTGILPVRVRFQGRMTPIVEFLDTVETMPRIAQVDMLKMRSVEGSAELVDVDLFIHAYFRPES